MNLLRLPPPMVLRLHCSRCRCEQMFDLLTVDQERHFHQYWCRVCGRNERITTEFANDLGARQATDTDVPRRKWGVRAALALIAKVTPISRGGGYRALPGPAEPRGLPPIPPKPSKGGATTAR